MEVTIKSNAKKVEKALKDKGSDISKGMKRALSRTAQHGINIIGDRMDSGRQINGAPYKPYTEKYAAFRTSKGRGKRVDLQFTRRMRGSMTSKADPKKATIFFTRPEEAKKAAMNNKTRPFFGFSRKEEKELAKVFFKAII
jgi:hypothetical protein